MTNTHKREISQLEKENVCMSQKIELSEAKIQELETKLSQKGEHFMKDLEEQRIKHQKERLKMEGEIDNLKQKLNEIEDSNKEMIWQLQRDVALMSERVKYSEYQKEQSRKELEDTEKRLTAALNQLKKNSEKGLEDSGVKRQSLDKRYSNQLELVKMSSKARVEDLEENNKKLKEETKLLKEKNLELQEKNSRMEKSINHDKNLGEEVEKLKREKEQLIASHRNELAKESDEFKRKMTEIEKKNRELERKNSEFVFILEKEKTKFSIERENLNEKIKELEDSLNWERKKNEGSNKLKTESGKSKRFSMTSSDVFGNRDLQ